jgi:NodT family efflux transporter outer membrane factor (OMF) lipoprotein
MAATRAHDRASLGPTAKFGSAGGIVGLAAICCCLLSGCDVGPPYVKPTMPAPAAFKEVSPAAYDTLPAGAWQPAQPQDAALKGKWWESFNEPELDALEDRLNIDNQNIAQFFQNFMAARAQVNEARAGYFPTVTVNPSYTRTRTGGAASSGTAGAGGGSSSGGAHYSTSMALPLEASWEPDLWGRIRNTVREFQYAAQVSAADLENERLMEQAALASYYFELRGQDALQELYDRTIEADRKALELTRALAETGIDNQLSVAQAEVTLRNAEATAIGIATNRALYEHAIATLIGAAASNFSMPVKRLETPVPEIPVAVPSQMLERRPDVAAAERTVAQANALIGVEMAAFYPTVSLTASGGLQAASLARLFSAPALFWSIGASAAETIYDGGLRTATVAQYTAAYRADVAAYKQTVLTAFQQVEDYLATLRVLSAQIIAQDEAVRAARRYLDLALAQYQTGLDPYLDVITAQTTLLADQQTLVTLRVNEMMAAVQLIQALGGGWDVKQLPAPSQVMLEDASRE